MLVPRETNKINNKVSNSLCMIAMFAKFISVSLLSFGISMENYEYLHFQRSRAE